MPSANVDDYPAFTDFAARYGADQASWAKLGIEWRTELACRAEMAAGGRADRARYGRLLAVEIGKATASRSAWEAVAREHERRHTAFEAELQAQRRWPALNEEIQRRRATSPTPTIRAAAAPPAPTTRQPITTPAPAPAATAGQVNPLRAHADHLERKGFIFTAARERQEIAAAEHQARRRRVEEQVRSDERLFATLVRNYGNDRAERIMQGEW